jgi:CMP-N-acetylneuraminic acid synthetase
MNSGVLAIVTARAGSKGLPGKNKAIIQGVPLIEYTVRALEEAKSVGAIVITTDDIDIIGRYRDRNSVYLVERPAEIAQDSSTSAEAMNHALKIWSDAGRTVPEVLLVAQPTSPLRLSSDIDKAAELFRHLNGESLVSVCRVEGTRHPRAMYRSPDGARGTPFVVEDHAPRQEYEPLFQRNGAIYLVTTEFFRRTGCLISPSPVLFEMPRERSIDIDGPGDLLIAKALIESGALAGAY